MLSDRSYMRDSYGRTTTSTLTWMLCALTAGFFIQTVFESAFESLHFKALTALSVGGIKSAWLWTFASYPILHSNVLHWLASLVTIFFLGRELLPLMGDRRFAWFCVFAGICGGLVWALVHYSQGGGELIGATPITGALLMLFACLHPNRPMPFLLFFMPVTIRPKHLAWAVAGISAVGLAVSEIPGDRFNLNIAHSAHLGGMLAALLYYRFVHLREWQTPDGRADIELPRWLSKSPKASPAEAPAKYTVNVTVPTRENLKAEVDRILDKINSEGLAALTAEEKRLLDEARNQISRR